MLSFVRRSAGKRGVRALADGGVPMVLGAALACVLAACAPAAAGTAGGQAQRHGAFSCRGNALRHKIAKAFVTGNHGLIVIDLAAGKAVKVKQFHDDFGAIVSPDGRTAYTANRSGSIVPIDVTTNAVGKPIPVPAGVRAATISPNGRVLYLAGDNGITPVFLRTCTTGRVIPTPGGLNPFGPFAITRDGRIAYLAGDPGKDDSTSTPGFLRIDLARGIAGKFLPVPASYGAPFSFSPDGRTAYFLGNSGPSIIPVSLATGKPGKPIKLPGVGSFAMAITPDGRTAYVGSAKPETPRDGLVIPVDLRAGTAGRPIHVPSYPFSISDIAIAPDGRTVYATNTTSVIPVHLAASKAGKPITLPDGAWSIALTP